MAVVEQMFGRQLQRFVDSVERWSLGGAVDGQLEAAIRNQICGELLNIGSLSVVREALASLGGKPAGKRLKALVDDCGQRFRLEDRTLSVIVAPVAVRLSAQKGQPQHHRYPRTSDIRSLETMMQASLGCIDVVFDRRLYDGRALWGARPMDLLEFCKRLEAGDELPEGGPPSVKLADKRVGQWQMVYLLGVVVSEPDKDVEIDEDDAQRKLMPWRCYAEWSLYEVDHSLRMGEMSEKKSICYGMLSLKKGVQYGENVFRAHLLEALMKEFVQGATGVWFYYALDAQANAVRLLITGAPMTVEFRWQLLRGETLEGGFEKELDRVIKMYVPLSEVRERCEMHLFDYHRKAREEGVSS